MGFTLQLPAQLSSHLRALRKARGMSQVELGRRLGLSQTRVARIEGDPLSVSVERLFTVLAALGVRVSLELVPTIPAPASISPAPAAGRSKRTAQTPPTTPPTPPPTRPAPRRGRADW